MINIKLYYSSVGQSTSFYYVSCSRMLLVFINERILLWSVYTSIQQTDLLFALYNDGTHSSQLDFKSWYGYEECWNKTKSNRPLHKHVNIYDRISLCAQIMKFN